MAFLSLGISFTFVYILTGDLFESLVVLPFSLIFHTMFKPNWMEFYKIVLSAVINIPKAILEGFEILFLKNERIEVLECYENERINKIISITLTPKSIVIMSDKRGLHIHRMVKK